MTNFSASSRVYLYFLGSNAEFVLSLYLTRPKSEFIEGQTSFLTPPFGFALFYMKAVAPKEVKIQEIYRGIIPFVLLQLIGLALVIAFPDIALWLPSFGD